MKWLTWQLKSSNSIKSDHKSTEAAILSDKVDVIESKVLGMEITWLAVDITKP